MAEQNEALPVESGRIFHCSVCDEMKTFSNFYRDRNHGSGVSRRCIPCDKAMAKERSKTRTNWGRRNQDHYAVTQVVKKAKLRGDLVPWPCCAIPDCSDVKVEAHHPDYKQPLSVVWLCRSHHAKIHAAARQPGAPGAKD